MKKRLLAVLLTVVMVVALLSACTSPKDKKEVSGNAVSETQKEMTDITLNEVAHSIFYAPMYVAIEEGYFAEEGIELTLITGFGADKTMTAVLSGEADIGFMGSEASIYTYNEGANDYVVNFAQLTQRAGNFLVAREEMPDFSWDNLKGSTVLGGRKGGMPEMVFEYILKQNGIDPAADLEINQSIDFGSTAAAFSEGQGDFTIEFPCVK
ncbi:NitT/TauT family transport system substrate-binding protein [Faecalicatena contorta]|uniref:NitT/TauT family transport system substrate-binding protein n=1 Tax=Faecalicatena contorta TaxID=39482 RepID=A0A316AE92_9FIRM|nr:ABC transporter substrate-binding protein [Faecalicatena contorta]PWJ48097.1 NitT/TauT family transport system substrate-binding protein [Faecalicatena contorta]SUQ15624.1 NitT/TauT family transport system substrate-binding protein [Faecalicatena contorta]